MNKKEFVFGKENFVLLAISIVLIIVGFVLMSGAETTEETGFNPEIFSARRIIIAPIVTMAGFITVIFAIMRKPGNPENKYPKTR
ncbi:MAG: DUF3098 domain-containing protein [Dysgonamonadaceae bacterium]|jgi:Ca2+/H+ antiporter|nr:DUF3098 domain-containing protein [Dysgonamonadaceae bacterium]